MDNDVIICRLCLEVVPTGYSLVQENVVNIIKALTSIDLSENDNLPKLSCSKCIFNLYFVEDIKKLIVKSDERLRSLFLRDGNFNELLKPVNPLEIEKLPEEKHFTAVGIKQEIIPPDEVTEEIEAHFDSVKEEIDTSEEEKVNENPSDSVTEDERFINSIIYKKNDKKPYSYHCSVCNVDYQGNRAHLAHKRKHLKKTCEICGVTTRQDNFYKHMKIHTMGQQICDICGSKHKSIEGLRTHVFDNHNATRKLYACGECGEKFKHRSRLGYHKRKVHTGFRPHQCDTCGKRFFDSDTLKRHVKMIHLKLREYHCKYCQKDYTTSYALKVHTRQHTNETPFLCDYCTEGFRQLVSLKTHLARYHKDKPSTSQSPWEKIPEEEKIDEDESLPQT